MISRKDFPKITSMFFELTRILTESDKLEDISGKILEIICRNLDLARGELWLTENDSLEYRAGWNAPGRNLEAFEEETRELSFEKGGGLPGKAWKECVPLSTPDVQKYQSFARKEAAKKTGLHAAVAFPIILQKDFEVSG